MGTIQLGLCQMKVTADKAENLRTAEEAIRTAARQGADLVLLPEMFNCPYENACFPVYAEPAGGETWQFLSRIAKELGIYLAGGSVPEREGDAIYNTCYLFSPKGEELARHRKVHLFDIDVPGGQRFMESDTLTAGDQITVVDTPLGKLGIAICFDIRFSELFRVMGDKGAQLILIPAAFNMTTGPAHWKILFRQRAVDQQCFTVGTSPARDKTASYVAWGHSIVCDPWSRVIRQCPSREAVAVTELDLSMVDSVRRQLPILSARREDVYQLTGL